MAEETKITTGGRLKYKRATLKAIANNENIEPIEEWLAKNHPQGLVKAKAKGKDGGACFIGAAGK